MATDIKKILELKQIYKSVFGSEDGKKVLEHLSKRCFVHRPTFSDIKGKTEFNEGQRSVVLHINNMMNIDIEATKKMMEQQEENKNNE